jgi:hypothetical protein
MSKMNIDSFILDNIEYIYYLEEPNPENIYILLPYVKDYRAVFFTLEYNVENKITIDHKLSDIIHLDESCISDFDLYINNIKIDEKYITGTIPKFKVDSVVFKVKNSNLPKKLILRVFNLHNNIKKLFSQDKLTNMKGLYFDNIIE